MAGLAGWDLQSTTGRNLKLLKDLSELDPWVSGSTRLKEALVEKERHEIPPMDHWRVSYLSSLLERRQQLHYQGEEEGVKQLSDLIDALCIN